MHMDLPGITHQYGPWSPVRFIPVPFRGADGEPPAFWLTTSRMCRGAHDWRCTTAQTQTFGPLVLEGATVADLYRCDNCARVQPPIDRALTQQPVCLFCTDMATVQHLGDEPDSAAALSAAAALYAASSTIRQVKEVDPSAFLALLDECGDMLRGLMDDAAWAIKQTPARAKYTGYAALTVIARQILANARTLAELSSGGELLPVKESDDSEG